MPTPKGFYAEVPRIVRIQYKDLSHAEKWLYTCLKDLCGDNGCCFRTLENLSIETDISVASLKTMIPHLYQVGLIQAEKKARGTGGKSLWHISIVDIWQQNREFCSKTNSQNLAIEEDETKSNSQILADNSQNLAIAPSVNSQNLANEQLKISYRRRLNEEDISEENKRGRIAPSERARAILDLCALQLGYQIARTAQVWKMAEELASKDVNATDEALTAVIARMKSLKYWKEKGGITFENVAANFGREWGMIQQQGKSPSSNKTSPQRSSILVSEEKRQRHIALAEAARQADLATK